MSFWHFSVMTPTLLPTPSFSVQKCHSHYFSMNEKQNNQAAIIIQNMWWKMLYWGRYWPPNWICKTFLSGLVSPIHVYIYIWSFSLPSNFFTFYEIERANKDHWVFSGLHFISQASCDQSLLETHIGSHIWPISLSQDLWPWMTFNGQIKPTTWLAKGCTS